MALRFKFKARPESRRSRFGGSGSPSKRTRGGSMARLKKKKEEPKEEPKKVGHQSYKGMDSAGQTILVEDIKKDYDNAKKNKEVKKKKPKKFKTPTDNELNAQFARMKSNPQKAPSDALFPKG